MSNIADLTASVSAPRVAAIEFPFGLTVGLPGDADGQRGALRAALAALEEIEVPGGVVPLPFALPESMSQLDLPPPEPPPITKYIMRHPWHLPNLMRREVPTGTKP